MSYPRCVEFLVSSNLDRAVVVFSVIEVTSAMHLSSAVSFPIGVFAGTINLILYWLRACHIISFCLPLVSVSHDTRLCFRKTSWLRMYNSQIYYNIFFSLKVRQYFIIYAFNIIIKTFFSIYTGSTLLLKNLWKP